MILAAAMLLLAAQQTSQPTLSTGGANPPPRLSYLEEPSAVYGTCVAAVANRQPAPSIATIGRGACRQPREILVSTIRYHVAERWSDLAENGAEARRISARVNRSAAGIIEGYEADLQRWLDARAAANGNQHAQN